MINNMGNIMSFFKICTELKIRFKIFTEYFTLSNYSDHVLIFISFVSIGHFHITFTQYYYQILWHGKIENIPSCISVIIHVAFFIHASTLCMECFPTFWWDFCPLYCNGTLYKCLSTKWYQGAYLPTCALLMLKRWMVR